MNMYIIKKMKLNFIETKTTIVEIKKRIKDRVDTVE